MIASKIEWTDNTWSPWRGCTKVSPGCLNCYAETLSKRNPAVLGEWGRGRPRVPSSSWGKPIAWDRAAEAGECSVCGSKSKAERFTGRCRSCNGERIRYRPRVFPSLCDPFDEEVSDDLRRRFLSTLFLTPNLRWQLLTKRPELIRPLLEKAMKGWSPATDHFDHADRIEAWLSGDRVPHNVWLGTSVEDQPRTDRIAHLLNMPAAGRFLSVEPLLGPVDLEADKLHDPLRRFHPRGHGIDWVIIGGESGPGSLPCHVDWVRSLVRQCTAAGVPCFVKQVGAVPVRDGLLRQNAAHEGPGHHRETVQIQLTHPKGGDPAEWPEDVRVRQIPPAMAGRPERRAA